MMPGHAMDTARTHHRYGREMDREGTPIKIKNDLVAH